MGDMLSQAEIDALLKGTGLEPEPQKEESLSSEPKAPKEFILTPEDKDALGEIGNISMGTSATTLYTLLGQRVSITTPRLKKQPGKGFKKFNKPYIAVKFSTED